MAVDDVQNPTADPAPNDQVSDEPTPVPSITLGSSKDLEDQHPHAAQEQTFPDGGFWAWSTVAGVWFMQFATFGYTNAYGVYNDYFVRIYLAEYTSSQISWIGSVQFMLTLSMGLFTGRAFDSGYFWHLVIAGSILEVFCLFMLSLAKQHEYYQAFLSLGLGLGFAIGLTYVPSIGIVAHYFKRHRAFALGVATSGSAVGGVIHPIVVNKLIYNPKFGFHGAVKVSAGVTAACLLLSMLLMRPRYPKKVEGEKHEETIGLWTNMKNFYSDAPYCFTSAATVLVLLGLYFPIFFLQTYAIDHGIDSNIAFYSLAMLNGANAIGRIFPNILVQSIGPFNVMIPTAFCASVLIFALAGVKSATSLIVFAILYGFFAGSYVGLLAPMLASLAHKHSEIGARIGICLSFTGLAGLIGTPIAGALLGTGFVWINPIIYGGVCVACGCASFTLARLILSRRKGTWRI